MLKCTTFQAAVTNRSSFRVLTNSAYIQTGASVLESLDSSLSTCPSDYYVIVSQPGVHSSDFSTRKSAPRLGAMMLGKDSSIRSKMSVDEVAGLVEPKEIKTLLENKCKAQTTTIHLSCELILVQRLEARVLELTTSSRIRHPVS
jgi:Tol biopolymer transport system component